MDAPSSFLSVVSFRLPRVGEVVRYTFRLRPGAQAQRVLTDEGGIGAGSCGTRLSAAEVGCEADIREAVETVDGGTVHNAWLRDGSQVAQQQMLRTYAQALDQSFAVKGCGRPAFKFRKKALLSLEFTRRGFRIRDGRLVLPKGISVPVVVAGVAVGADECSDHAGFAGALVCLVRRPPRRIPPHRQPRPGLVSTGVWLRRPPRPTAGSICHISGTAKRCAAELARAQRRMARATPVSADPNPRVTSVRGGRRRGCTRRRPAKLSTTAGCIAFP